MNILVTNIIILALSGLTLAKLDMSKICQNNNLGDVIKNPEDCNSYIVCENLPLIQYCEKNLHFDSKRKVCNWPEYAQCQLQYLPNDTELETKDDAIKEPAHPEVNEELNNHYSPLVAIDIMTGDATDAMIGYDPQHIVCRHFGAYFLPHPSKCRAYILCAYGHIHEHSCGMGTMWNYRKQQCEMSVKAECYQKTMEENKEISSSIPLSNDNPLMVCYNLAPTTTDGLHTNTWHPTGSIYNATAQSTSTTTAMSSSTYSPTPQASTTETPKSSSKVTSKSPSTASPVVNSSKSPNSADSILLVCPNKTQSYIAHPKDCSKYYMCIMGMPVQTSCPVGLFWDSKLGYCDLAKNVKCFQ